MVSITIIEQQDKKKNYNKGNQGSLFFLNKKRGKFPYLLNKSLWLPIAKSNNINSLSCII